MTSWKSRYVPWVAHDRRLLNDSYPEQRPREVPRNLVQVQLFHFQFRLPCEARHLLGSIEGAIRNIEDPPLGLQGGGGLLERRYQVQLGQLAPFLVVSSSI